MRRILYFYLYLFIVWGIYRYTSDYSEIVDEFVVKPLLWLIPIAVIILFFEKRNVVHGIHLHFRTVFHDSLFGGIAGLFIFLVFLGSLYIQDGNITFNPHNYALWAIVPLLSIALARALTEEIAFRGFIQSRLKRDKHSHHWANIVTTCMFVAINIPVILAVKNNPPIITFTQLALLTELSLIDGYLFHTRAGLLAPIISHTMWAFAVLWVV